MYCTTDVIAGESKQSQGLQKKEKRDQQDEKGPQTVTLKFTSK